MEFRCCIKMCSFQSKKSTFVRLCSQNHAFLFNILSLFLLKVDNFCWSLSSKVAWSDKWRILWTGRINDGSDKWRILSIGRTKWWTDLCCGQTNVRSDKRRSDKRRSDKRRSQKSRVILLLWKCTEHFIRSTGHFDLFYCAKSIILLNTIYLQINFLNTDHFIKNT